MRALLIIIAIFLGIYLLFVLGLYIAGRKTQARAVAGFIPDCIVLFKHLLSDKRVHRRYKIILALLIGYLASPIDIIPDFIPVAGQLDDAIIVALVLRFVMKRAGKKVITEQWPGPQKSLDVILKLAGQ